MAASEDDFDPDQSFHESWIDRLEQEQEDAANLPPIVLQHDDNDAMQETEKTLDAEDQVQKGQGHMDPNAAQQLVDEVIVEAEDDAAKEQNITPMVLMIQKMMRGTLVRKKLYSEAELKKQELLEEKVLQGHIDNVIAVFHVVHNVKHVHRVMLEAQKSKNALVALKDNKGNHTYDLKAVRNSAIAFETVMKSYIDSIKVWKLTLDYEEHETKSGNRKYKVYKYDGTVFPVDKHAMRKTQGECRKFRALEHSLDKLCLGDGQISGEGKKEKITFKKDSVIDKYYKAMITKASSEKAMRHHTRTHEEPKASSAETDAPTPATPEQSMFSRFTSTGILAAILHQSQGAVGTQQKTARSRSVGRASRPSQTTTDARPGWMNNLGM